MMGDEAEPHSCVILAAVTYNSGVYVAKEIACSINGGNGGSYR
jgi:hypothetical protein